MSNLIQKAFLEAKTPFIQLKRFRGKINIQRPRAPHYERAKVLAVCTPQFTDPKVNENIISLCTKTTDNFNKVKVDNPFENILAKECRNWFHHSTMIAFFHSNPISAEDHFKASVTLKQQNMHLKTYGKAILEKALKDTNYASVLQLFTSHSIIIFSQETQVSKMLKIMKKVPQMVLMAGIVDNTLLSYSQLLAYNKMPDLQQSRAGLVQVLNTAAVTLTSHLSHHQRTLVSNLQQHVNLQTSNTNEVIGDSVETNETKIENKTEGPVEKV